MISLISVVFTSSAVAKDEDAEAKAERIGSGNPVAGKIKSRTELCQECHGEAGVTESTVAGVPHLAGQYSGYVVKQLHNFKSGERAHPIMKSMAENLPESDAADIAAYFASSKTMQGNGVADNEVARSLFVRGDMKRNIMSCKSCHGETGKGNYSANDIYPVIGGQRKFYLREQLLNWRAGTRRNSPDGVMNIIAKSLSDTEIEALSEYISGM